jgi:ribonuclease E
MKGETAALAVTLPLAVALYILNQKRDRLVALEQRYGMSVGIAVDTQLIAGDYRVESTAAKVEGETPEPRAEPAAEAATPPAASEEEADGGRKRRRRRRRRRRPGDGETEADGAQLPAAAAVIPSAPAIEGPEPEPAGAEVGAPMVAEAAPRPERKPRRQRRRSGTRRGETETRVEPMGAGAVENGADHAVAPLSDGASAGVTETPVPADEVPVSETPPVPTDRAERHRRPAHVEQAPEPKDRPEPELPAAALVDQERPAAPRRGWWSRFVHKDE